MQKEGFTYLEGEYQNKYSKLKWLSPTNEELSLSWHSIKQGYRQAPIKKNSQKEVEEKAKELGYQLLTPYINARKPILWKCPNDHKFESSWNRWTQRKEKCTKCIKHGRDEAQIKKEIKKMGYKLVDEYKSCHEYIEVEFEEKIYQTKWDWLRAGRRPENKPEISLDQVVSAAIREGYEVLSKSYQVNDSTLNWKCPEGHIYKQTWKTFKQGHRCPVCGKQKSSGFSTSKAEKEIASFIRNNNFKVEENNRTMLNGSELDVVVHSHKLAIEHNGLYWHSLTSLRRKKKTAKELREYHREKRIKCEKLGYRLLTIHSDEWANKKYICQQMILSRLGVSSQKVHARKCEVKKVKYSSLKNFFEQNHLMGATFCKGIGLYHNGELVSLLGYKKIKDTIKIERFASKLGYQVNGGFSKLIKRLPKCKSIQSFVDLRYGDGHSYEKLGFTRIGETLGWKWTNNVQTFNRLYCRANMDNRKLSMMEHAAEMKLSQIYDCGQAKYVLYV